MSFICTCMSLVCHPYVTRMYSYILICMSLVCTRISSVCHSYVLVCHPYVTRMYSYAIRLSLIRGFTINLFLLSIFKKLSLSPFFLFFSLLFYCLLVCFLLDMNVIFHRLIVYEETIRNRFYLLSCFSYNFYFTLLCV